MVNGINATNVINQTNVPKKEENLGKLVKYVNNEALKDTSDTFSSTLKGAAGSVALFNGIPLVKYLIGNKKVYKNFVTNGMKNLDAYNMQALKDLFKGEGKILDRVSNYINKSNKIKEALSAEKKLTSSIVKGENLWKKAAKKAKNAKGFFSKKSAEKAAKKFEAAKLKAIANGENVSNAISAIGTAGKEAGKLGKLKGIMKSSGAGLMLVFSGIMECAMEVIPTFKELGVEKGIKQLGKSAIKVAGDTFGFIAGEQVGTAIGSAIGTAIFPGIGTAIGAIVGFAGGMIGSWAMGKLTKKITGKSEREIAKDEQQKQVVSELSNNQAAQDELKTLVKAKIQEEQAQKGGKLSEDAKIALEALNELEQENNPFASFATV